jgi:predicted nucleic acid-binding protein
MPFVVLYDANALYGNAQRDLLVRIARAGLVQAKWTDEILAEMTRARLRRNPDLAQEKLDRLCELMRLAVADCMVTGYQDLIDNLKLPDPDDRHVLAAAIRAHAQVLVTANLRHSRSTT